MLQLFLFYIAYYLCLSLPFVLILLIFGNTIIKLAILGLIILSLFWYLYNLNLIKKYQFNDYEIGIKAFLHSGYDKCLYREPVFTLCVILAIIWKDNDVITCLIAISLVLFSAFDFFYINLPGSYYFLLHLPFLNVFKVRTNIGNIVVLSKPKRKIKTEDLKVMNLSPLKNTYILL